ncbi:MAG: uracil-DNA glycosylase family protein [Elusimicrobiota bacterium]
MVKEVGSLRFRPPVAYAYNPLVYARRPHRMYLERYGKGRREVILLGMNPGPFGMAQTGVPFGEVSLVRDWLGIEAPVDKPEREHPKRPVEGFACRRSEVSGARLWGWARDRFKTPRRFFSRFLILNYCPLAFMEAGGRNLTPDKLPAEERGPLFGACDRALRRLVERYRPRHVIGIGGFAEKRARAALAGTSVRVGTVLHPSPASPLANRGWAQAAEAGLSASGVNFVN